MASVATTPRTIPLLGDATVEVHPATGQFPPCLRFSDGDDHCSVDLNALTWARIVEAVSKVMEGTRQR